MRRIVIALFLLLCGGVAGGAFVAFHGSGSDSQDAATTTAGGATTAATQPTKDATPVDLAHAAASRFNAAWARGDDKAAARLTDHPKTAASALIASRKGLDGASVSPKVTAVKLTDIGARATIDVTWQVPGFGPWHYTTAMPLNKLQSGAWRVVWTPHIIYPTLSEDTRLGTERTEPKRAPILDRTGMEILGDRPVVDVGLERDKVTNVTASGSALAKLVGVDGATLIRQVKGAGPKEFVVAVTMRPADFKPIA